MKRFTLVLFFCFLNGELVSPLNNQTIHARYVNFKWDQVPDAVYYQLSVASDPDFQNINFTVLDSTLSSIDTEHFDWDQTFYWTISAFDGADSMITAFGTSVFHTGSAKYPNTSLILNDTSQSQGGLTIFGTWYSWQSGAIDETGEEIWNDGDLGVMLNTVDEYGQLFGAQDYPDDNAWMRGIHFDINHNLLWAEPLNTSLNSHALRRMPNGDYVGMRRADQLGPIPLGEWTEYFQNLGYVADGVTNEIEWFGGEIVIFDQHTNEDAWTWNPFDHFTMDDVDLYGGTWWNVQWWGYDWLHSNSLYFDENQSSFYLSNRHLSRISKINYPSGEVEWMMGLPEQYMASGSEHICSELLFSFQHDAELLPNGNLLFYDNGNLSPMFMNIENPITRIFEVSINEEGSCDIVWEYDLPEDLYAIGMGSVQKLNNGNYHITSGNQCGTLLEVNPEQEIVWQISLGLDECTNSLYRGFKVKTLFPQNFSLILNRYSYIDESQSIPGIIVDENNPLSFTIHNESPDEIQFLATTYLLADSIETSFNDPIEFSVETGATQSIEIPVGSLDAGLNNLKLNVKPFPFYREGESVEFSILKSQTMDIDPVTPESFRLLRNYPNPFNPYTIISFNISDGEAEMVSIGIFDLKGQLVKTLVSGKLNSGSYEIAWDGTNEVGQSVAAGVYITRAKIGEFIETRKMTLVK